VLVFGFRWKAAVPKLGLIDWNHRDSAGRGGQAIGGLSFSERTRLRERALREGCAVGTGCGSIQ
jgi:hypothetical protein